MIRRNINRTAIVPRSRWYQNELSSYQLATDDVGDFDGNIGATNVRFGSKVDILSRARNYV